MAGFLYYFPGVSQPIATVEALPAVCGLQSILEGATIETRQVTCGPENTAGYMVSPQPAKNSGGNAARCGYYPDKQDWRKVENIAGEVLYWLGVEKDAKPGPRDLMRPRPVDGHPVEMADKHSWIVPAVHAPLATLPKQFVVSPQGVVGVSFSDEYDEITKEAAEWYELARSGGKYGLAKWFAYAVKLFSINYRVGIHEFGALNICDSRNDFADRVIEASLGLPAIIAELDAQKKTGIASAG